MDESLCLLLRDEIMISDFLIKKIENTFHHGQRLSEKEYEFIHDKCMDFLQRTGFDEDYNLTIKGKLIESFIDRLFDLHS